MLKNVKELSKTICEKFLPSNKYINELDKISELAVNSVGKREFKNFLILKNILFHHIINYTMN